jgi:hypothetical protein
LFGVEADERVESLRTDEGGVAGENKDVGREGIACLGEVGLRGLEGVAGAALLRLKDEVNASWSLSASWPMMQ